MIKKTPCFPVVWAMPNKSTFSIKPIKRFIDTWINGDQIFDPFCGDSTLANNRNDIKFSGIDSLVWLKKQPDNCADTLLFDPAYTPRQLKECYNSLGLSLHDTKASYWSALRDEIVRIVKPGGICLSFGYGASQIGKKRGFDILDGLVVLHGGVHNATICMAEVKL